MPDVEQKYSTLKSSIRANCSNPDNVDLQARLKDMLEVVANLGRIAEGFGCSTRLRLVPVRNNNPDPSRIVLIDRVFLFYLRIKRTIHHGHGYPPATTHSHSNRTPRPSA